MTMKTLGLLAGLCVLGSVGLLLAQDAETPAPPATEAAKAEDDPYAKLRAKHAELKIDKEALKKMSHAERGAYMRNYKRRLEAEVRAAGVQLPTGGKFTRFPTPRKSAPKARAKVAGTNITYDTGTVTGGAGIASQMLGNRFDSALNPAGTMCCFPVEASGSITMITFDLQAIFFTSVFFSLYSNIMGTTAVMVTSTGVVPTMVPGLNTISIMSPTIANAYMNGAFLAGIWQLNVTMTVLGVDTGTTGGQGFHAISINDNPGSLLMTVTDGMGGGLNAIFRVSGDVATPVELMNFQVK